MNKARKDERELMKRYWKASFPEAQGESINSYFDVYYHEDETCVLRNKDEIIASAQVKPKVLNLNGKKVKVAYITHVMSRPEFQGQGNMTKLMSQILEEVSKTDLITVLRPFEPKVFRSLGFENVIEICEYNINVSKLPIFNVEGIILGAKPSALLQIYHNFTKHFDGYFDRDEKYYEALIEYISLRKGNIVALRDGDHMVGYCVYLTHATHIEVIECLYDMSGTLVKLLSFISRGKSRVVLKASTSEKIHKLFPDAIKSTQPFLMAHINDKELFERLFNIRILSSYSAFNAFGRPLFNRDYQ